ncbi:hypothetical protein O7Q_00063 [Bartonella quintana JK 39]|uniref:BID domain-containing T4SS effector n=1 Tax=Bartonella quintana TaxID=803 RepID=UPI0004A11D70|nr:BID domain-containing T4SS effector [Bartonella quintana]KEC69210.1 hypothetical protein O7Q_00063 [Bartonella quintana JK 39]
MKKNQPSSPSIPRSVEEARRRYEQAPPGSASPPEPLYATVNKKTSHTAKKPEQGAPQAPLFAASSPQRPPRLRDRELHKTTIKEEEIVYASLVHPPHRDHKHPRKNPDNETLYATVAPQSQAMSPTREKKEGIVYASLVHPPHTDHKHPRKNPDNETLYATVASQNLARQSQAMSLTREEMATRIQQSPSVQAYQQEVSHWCQIVFGNSRVLQERVQEILQKPNLAEEVSWQVAENPQAFHKLAGISLCGITNSARRHAEAGLSHLCTAIENYGDAVKQAHENIMHVPHAEARRHEEDRTRSAQSLQQPHHPERGSASLSSEEMLGMVQSHTSIQRYHAQIDYWCKIVFGNSRVLQERVQEILQKPNLAEEVSWQVAENPQAFHKLAGISLCGITNSARRHAEAGLSHLCTAIENYGDAVKQVKESIVQTHQTRQNRQEQASGLSQSVQKQQTLSKPPKLPERPTVTARNEETSRQQAHQQAPDVRPRRIRETKAIAFAS